jgi:N6-L-threonylcarbamoyladenine synthase
MLIEKSKYLLAIETSCDETSFAFIDNNNKIFEKTFTSIEEQKKYNGVVPELASRMHEKYSKKIFDELINENNIDIKDIQAIGYTSEPGLIGCIHIGKVFAKTLGYILDVEVFKLNHMEGHIFSFAIEDEKIIKYPFLSLVISGGNTILYQVNSLDDIKILNETSDIAVGEAYDKIGIALGFKYPCGKDIDDLYDENKANIVFTKKTSPETNSFSFSGFKTAVLNHIIKEKNKNTLDIESIASSFQKAIIDSVVKKVKYYAEITNINTIVIGGGVASNTYLKKEISSLNIKSFLTSNKYTNDNASMMAFIMKLKHFS